MSAKKIRGFVLVGLGLVNLTINKCLRYLQLTYSSMIKSFRQVTLTMYPICYHMILGYRIANVHVMRAHKVDAQQIFVLVFEGDKQRSLELIHALYIISF